MKELGGVIFAVGALLLTGCGGPAEASVEDVRAELVHYKGMSDKGIEGITTNTCEHLAEGFTFEDMHEVSSRFSGEVAADELVLIAEAGAREACPENL